MSPARDAASSLNVSDVGLFFKQIVEQLDVSGDLDAAVGSAVSDGVGFAGSGPLDAGLGPLLVARVEE